MRKVIIEKPTEEQSFYVNDDVIGLVHLVEDVCDGEHTSCGVAYVDVNHHLTNMKINCKICLNKIRFYRSLRFAKGQKSEVQDE